MPMDSGSGSGGPVKGDLEALATDAHGLQAISDTQAALLHQLSGTMEHLSTVMSGSSVQVALQTCAERLEHDGMQFTSKFADHSDMMTNNRTILDNVDADVAHGWSAVNGSGGMRVN